MKLKINFLAIFVISFFGVYAHTACFNVSGSYEINSGIPNCAGGTPAVKAWKKFEQTHCKQVSVTKVFKLEDGSFCEDLTFFRTDDGKEQHYEGSDYASTFQILNNEHVNKVRHLINPDQSFDLHFTLDRDGNLITEAIYKNGYVSKEFFARSEIK